MEPYREEDRKRLESRIDKFRSDEESGGGWNPWQGLSLIGSLGLSVGICIVAGIALGVYLDKKWHTQPWLTLVGLIVGLGAAAKITYELIKASLKND